MATNQEPTSKKIEDRVTRTLELPGSSGSLPGFRVTARCGSAPMSAFTASAGSSTIHFERADAVALGEAIVALAEWYDEQQAAAKPEPKPKRGKVIIRCSTCNGKVKRQGRGWTHLEEAKQKDHKVFDPGAKS